MKCRYIYVEGVGDVLIPGCMSTAVANDIDFCTCSPEVPKTFAAFERQRYNDTLKEKNETIKRLIAERDTLFDENQELYKRLKELDSDDA